MPNERFRILVVDDEESVVFQKLLRDMTDLIAAMRSDIE